jgi:hypothetical protein
MRNPGCAGGHVLLYAEVPDAWGCDVCKAPQDVGTASHGCRVCNYDVCATCYQNPEGNYMDPWGRSHKVHASGTDYSNAGQFIRPPGQPKVFQKPPQDPAAPPPPAVQHESQGRMRALFVGINYYKSQCQLNGCINDVAVMMNLAQSLGFDISDRRVLVDDASFPARTGHPTRDEIIASLKWLTEGAQAGDDFLFHYSGHGAQDKGDDGSSHEALVPVDYQTDGLLQDDELFDVLVKDLPAGARVTTITDCCHSGDVCNLKYMWQWTRADRSQGVFVENAARPPILGEMFVFTGCRNDQTSADVSDIAEFHNKFGKGAPGVAGGALTNALAEAIGDRLEPDGKCHVAIDELLHCIQDNLKRRAFTQIPQLSSSRNIDANAQFSFFGMVPELQN